MKKWILCIAAILLLCSSVARAGAFDDAEEAYQKGNYVKAFELFHPLAIQGNASAQFILGLIYYNGEGVTQDYKEAGKWYRLAAEQGDVTAQYGLGLMYATGTGVIQNHVRAYMWLSLSANNEDKSAKINLEKLAKKNAAFSNFRGTENGARLRKEKI